MALLGSCNKKGCTDIKAYNYNKKSEKDDGSCKYYQAVSIKSATINNVPSTNNGNFWDTDDNSAADVYIAIQKPDGTFLESGTVYYENPSISETNPIIFDINKLVLDFEGTHTLYILDFDAAASTDEVVFSHTFRFKDYTYEGDESNKFPTTITLNNQLSEVVIDLEWSEN